MKKKFYITIIIIMVVLLAGCGTTANQAVSQNNSGSQSQKKITLSYAFFAPANTFPAVQMEKWKSELEKRTNGKVEAKLFPGGSLLDANNMYDGVSKRVDDIGLSCPTYEPGRYPLLSIAEMPSGYPNGKVASEVVYDLIKEYPLDALKDFKIITAFATEPSYIQSKVPISNLEELKGKQLRISGSLTPIMKALGAAPVGMSQADVPQSLQTGVIVGNISSREVLKDLKLAETEKYITDYPLTVTTFVAVMNKDVWNSLPKDVQAVIDELSPEMAVFAGDYLDKHVQEALDWSQKQYGLKTLSLTPEEKKRWDEILKPLQDNYVKELEGKGLTAQKYKDRLYELIKKYSK